jgi:hypothetical protein
VLVAALTIVIAAAPAPAHAPAGQARAATTSVHPERFKTLQIARNAGEGRRVLMSIGPKGIGELSDGDRLEATAEFEVTVCLKPNPHHNGNPYPCIGDMYGYDPVITAQIVLARGETSTGPVKTTPISSRKSLRCSQTQPDRNHHCVLVIPRSSLAIPDTHDLPCPPANCHVNLVVNAFHHNARKGQQVVIGSYDRNRVIGQNRGRLNAVRLRPGDMAKPRPARTQARSRRHLTISDDGREPPKHVVYSLPLHHLHGGDQLVVDGKASPAIAHLPYSVFFSSEVILAKHPGSTDTDKTSNRVIGFSGDIGKRNGSNCTQGHSGFDTPCTIRKVGVVKVAHGSKRTRYLNFVLAAEAKLLATQHWHRGDAAKMLRGGYLRAYRYPR